MHVSTYFFISNVYLLWHTCCVYLLYTKNIDKLIIVKYLQTNRDDKLSKLQNECGYYILKKINLNLICILQNHESGER